MPGICSHVGVPCATLPEALVGDDREPADLGLGDDERIRAVAAAGAREHAVDTPAAR
jgi:hypothetical protein